ncbi:MAG: DUF192 domain-containing protein [Planctomycetota bacterium]|nr:MAG: DUF192 domain-containing protein [Planctomycetota bacterium]
MEQKKESAPTKSGKKIWMLLILFLFLGGGGVVFRNPSWFGLSRNEMREIMQKARQTVRENIKKLSSLKQTKETSRSSSDRRQTSSSTEALSAATSPSASKKAFAASKKRSSSRTSEDIDTGSRASADMNAGNTNVVFIRGYRLHVLLATTRLKRQEGFSVYSQLGPNEGMLYIYPSERRLVFQIGGVKFPLSVAFLDAEGRIVKIADMPVGSEEKHATPPGQPAKYALEVHLGWFQSRGIRVGDVVQGLEKLSISKVEKEKMD